MQLDTDRIRQLKARRSLAIDDRDQLINKLLQLQDQVTQCLAEMAADSKLIAEFNEELTHLTGE